MLRQLESIGIYDTVENRDYLLSHIETSFFDSINVIRRQRDSRIIKDSLLMGPRGTLRMETIWQGDKLITFFLKSGGE